MALSEKYLKATNQWTPEMERASRGIPAITVADLEVVQLQETGEEPVETVDEVVSFRCKVCGKHMPSAMALRGHMKKHE
jgi:hypothetical protein